MDAIGLLAGTGWASGSTSTPSRCCSASSAAPAWRRYRTCSGRTDVLAVVGASFLVEFVVDKIP